MFLEFARSRGLRLTSQRMIIIDTIFATEDHFTAEQLFERVRAKDAAIGRATIYRTLRLLTESGLLQDVDLGKDQKYYDPNYILHPNHNHIICEDCDRVLEFENPRLEELENEIIRDLGFEIRSQRIQITAHCEQLKQSGSCVRKDCH